MRNQFLTGHARGLRGQSDRRHLLISLENAVARFGESDMVGRSRVASCDLVVIGGKGGVKRVVEGQVEIR